MSSYADLIAVIAFVGDLFNLCRLSVTSTSAMKSRVQQHLVCQVSGNVQHNCASSHADNFAELIVYMHLFKQS